MQKKCNKHGVTEWSEGKRPRCRKCNVENVTKRRQKLKRMAVEHKGGKCIKCGYNKCIAALEFHHTDPSQKDFHISHDNIRSWERVKAEIEKCILVCANCHAEIHYLEQQGIEVEW